MALPITSYGFGPEQLFYPASPLAGRAPPPPVQPAPVEQPAPILTELFSPNTDATAPAGNNPHPEPSARNALRSAITGLGLMSPAGFAMGMFSLAASDALGMKPSLSRTEVAGELGRRALGRSSYNNIDDVADPAAIGDKPAAALDVQSIFSGGVDAPPSLGEVTDNHDNGMGAGFGYARGGRVRGYAGGGVVELFGGGKVAMGPGGGMDDLIPTTIDGGRLANLSDGEFVIPADVVSAMGDGSTNAGASRLYDLVKAVRQAKTGSEQQAQPVQFDRILKQVTGR